MIDSRAEIHPEAKIGSDVTIGPWTVIGPNVEIGDGTIIGPHVVIAQNTRIGKNNHIYQFASIGENPQDKKYAGEETWLEIGDGNRIREFCTFNRGTVQDKCLTKIGNNNLFMAYVHIAHDCIIGDETLFVNNSSLAGHVVVGDYAILGGFSGVHQYVRIGEHSMIGKSTYVKKDVVPYVMLDGYDPRPRGINSVGLKRRGFSEEQITNIKRAYKTIFREGNSLLEASAMLEELISEQPEVACMVSALNNASRSITR